MVAVYSGKRLGSPEKSVLADKYGNWVPIQPAAAPVMLLVRPMMFWNSRVPASYSWLPIAEVWTPMMFSIAMSARPTLAAMFSVPGARL